MIKSQDYISVIGIGLIIIGLVANIQTPILPNFVKSEKHVSFKTDNVNQQNNVVLDKYGGNKNKTTRKK